MDVQNVLGVGCNYSCSAEEGPEVERCMNRIFHYAADEVKRVREPVDWLVIDSDALVGITFGSMNFFEEQFEHILGEVVGRSDIRVVRFDSVCHNGKVDIGEWITRALKESKRVPVKFLNNFYPHYSYVGYHLQMR